MDKYPPILIMETIHSNIKNIRSYSWFVLATPFFSKMNDCEDSSFEYIAREKYSKYKPPNYKNKLYFSIFKNFLLGLKNLISLIFKSKLKIKNPRVINNDVLIVDYFVNKKSKNTILNNVIKNLENPTIWLIDSNLDYDKELNKFTLYEVTLFLFLIIKSIFYLPYRKLGLKYYLLESARNFNLFYTFKYFLAGRDIKKLKIKKLYFLYEDEPRDRMLLQDNSETEFFGYIHTSLIHQWRLNKFFSESDVFIPHNLIFNDYYSFKLHSLLKFKNYKKEKLISNFVENLNKEKFRSISNSYKNKILIDNINILIFMPNNLSLSNELVRISEDLKNEFNFLKVVLFPHPNLLKKIRIKSSSLNHKLNKNKDIVVSSYRTNKGMELYRQGFKVIYFGSESYFYYIPYDKSMIPIYFAEDILQLKTFLHAILNKKN